LSAPAHTLSLHSFPTRRSSDLRTQSWTLAARHVLFFTRKGASPTPGLPEYSRRSRRGEGDAGARADQGQAEIQVRAVRRARGSARGALPDGDAVSRPARRRPRRV